MKFTKTLAISLLTLSAMQLVMAETVEINLTKETKKFLTFPQKGTYKIGDVIKLTYNKCIGCDPEKSALEVPENYLTILPAGMLQLGGGKEKTVMLQITGKPAPKENPLIVHANGITFNIWFKITKPTIIDLIKHKEQEVSSNKVFEIGDAIELIFIDVKNLVTYPPVAKTIDIHIPNYLTQIKDESMDMPKEWTWTGSNAKMRHLTLKVTDASDGTPITIGYKEDKEPEHIVNITALKSSSEAAPK